MHNGQPASSEKRPETASFKTQKAHGVSQQSANVQCALISIDPGSVIVVKRQDFAIPYRYRGLVLFSYGAIPWWELLAHKNGVGTGIGCFDRPAAVGHVCVPGRAGHVGLRLPRVWQVKRLVSKRSTRFELQGGLTPLAESGH